MINSVLSKPNVKLADWLKVQNISQFNRSYYKNMLMYGTDRKSWSAHRTPLVCFGRKKNVECCFFVAMISIFDEENE